MRLVVLSLLILSASFSVSGWDSSSPPPLLEAGDGTMYFGCSGLAGRSYEDVELRYGRTGVSLLSRFGVLFRMQGKILLQKKGVKSIVPPDCGSAIAYSLSNVLSVTETVRSVGNGAVVLSISLSNTGTDEVEVDVAFILKPGKEYRPLLDSDGDFPTGVWSSVATAGPSLAYELYSGEKRRPLHGKKLKDFIKSDNTILETCHGKYSSIEIDEGKMVTVHIILGIGADVARTRKKVKRILRLIKKKELRARAIAFRANRLRKGVIPAFRTRRGRSKMYNALERFCSRLVYGWYYGGKADALENIRAAYALMDYGFYAKAGTLLNRLTRLFRRNGSRMDTLAAASYVSLVLDYFMRSGKFRGSLKLAARYLALIAESPLPEGAAAADPLLAVTLSSAFIDGSQLMGYARQRSLQEKYSRLARKWIRHFRASCRKPGEFVPRKRSAAGGILNGSMPVSPKLYTRLYRGFAGRLVAWYLAGGGGEIPREDFALLARLAFRSGYPILGGTALKRSVFPSTAQLRAVAAAQIYGPGDGIRLFTNAAVKRLQEMLIRLGRVSGPIRNCFPFRNAAARVRGLMRSGRKLKTKDLLRFVSTVRRLRSQVQQTVQEFSQRNLAMERVDALLAAGQAMLARKYRVFPRLINDNGTVTFSFLKAPELFVRKIRSTISVSVGFKGSVEKSSRDYSLSLRFSKGRLKDGYGGARYLFRSRYNGVDFRFRHARVLRTRFPFRIMPFDSNDGTFKFTIYNDHTGPLWDLRAVLSFGFKIMGGFDPPNPGKAADYTVVCRSNQAYGDYPGVITAKVAGQTYSANLTFRHGERVPFGTWYAKMGDSFYWKNPEYRERGWREASSSWLVSSSLRNVHWVRSGFTLNERHRGRKKYIYLGPRLAMGKVYLNMTPLHGSGVFRQIPEGVLLYGRRNVLAVRVPAGIPAGDNGRKTVVYVYGKE